MPLTSLQHEIINVLYQHDEYLSVPAIAHKISDTARVRYSRLGEAADELVAQGLLNRRRKTAGSKNNSSRYVLSAAMREALIKRMDSVAQR